MFVVLEKQQALFNRNFSSRGKAISHSNEVWEKNVRPVLVLGAPGFSCPHVQLWGQSQGTKVGVELSG